MLWRTNTHKRYYIRTTRTAIHLSRPGHVKWRKHALSGPTIRRCWFWHHRLSVFDQRGRREFFRKAVEDPVILKCAMSTRSWVKRIKRSTFFEVSFHLRKQMLNGLNCEAYWHGVLKRLKEQKASTIAQKKIQRHSEEESSEKGKMKRGRTKDYVYLYIQQERKSSF